MSHNRDTLIQKKALLLSQIQQQRLDLMAQQYAWIEKTAPFDQGILTLLGWRKYLMLASSLFVIYAARHPAKTIRYSRYIVSALGTLQLIRRTFRV